MSAKTKIEWADVTINPIVGCSKCSPGCDNCYAEKRAYRLSRNELTAKKYAGVVDEHGNWTGKINSFVYCDDRDMPHRVPGKGKRVFIGSMTDLFHPAEKGLRLQWWIGAARNLPFYPCRGHLSFFKVDYPHPEGDAFWRDHAYGAAAELVRQHEERMAELTRSFREQAC